MIAAAEVKREAGRHRATHNARIRAWQGLALNGYAGFRSCSSCEELAYCRGRRYETQRCLACHMANRRGNNR